MLVEALMERRASTSDIAWVYFYTSCVSGGDHVKAINRHTGESDVGFWISEKSRDNKSGR
jgi:hypothetical protein